MKITNCTGSDAPAMLRIEEESFDEPYTAEMFDEMLCDPLSINLKAEENGELAGYISIQTVLDEAQVISIAVHPAHRGRGVAKALLSQALTAVRLAGAQTVFLEVNENNQPAINLYLKFGFKQIALRPKYYGDDSAIIMKLML